MKWSIELILVDGGGRGYRDGIWKPSYTVFRPLPRVRLGILLRHRHIPADWGQTYRLTRETQLLITSPGLRSDDL